MLSVRTARVEFDELDPSYRWTLTESIGPSVVPMILLHDALDRFCGLLGASCTKNGPIAGYAAPCGSLWDLWDGKARKIFQLRSIDTCSG